MSQPKLQIFGNILPKREGEFAQHYSVLVQVAQDRSRWKTYTLVLRAKPVFIQLTRMSEACIS